MTLNKWEWVAVALFIGMLVLAMSACVTTKEMDTSVRTAKLQATQAARSECEANTEYYLSLKHDFETCQDELDRCSKEDRFK